METTLVTGATGMIGNQIVQALLRRGRQVRALVRSLEKGRALLPDACEVVQGDITDPAAVRQAMQGCEVVYHAAGYHEEWLADPAEFERVNAGGTQHALEAALELGVRRFMYTSTIDVFEGEAGKEFDETRMKTQPAGTYYERSKQVADQKVTAALQRGLPAIFLHPAAVYGPGLYSSPGVNGIIKQLLQGQLPALPPGGFALVFAPDVGEGHLLAEEKADVGSRYILSETCIPFKQFAQAVFTAAGTKKSLPVVLPLPIARGLAVVGEWLSGFTHKPPLLAKGALHFLLWQAIPNSQKAQRELGWKPLPLAEGLRQTVAYLNQHLQD